jgi:hypothetical protein
LLEELLLSDVLREWNYLAIKNCLEQCIFVLHTLSTLLFALNKLHFLPLQITAEHVQLLKKRAFYARKTKESINLSSCDPSVPLCRDLLFF